MYTFLIILAYIIAYFVLKPLIGAWAMLAFIVAGITIFIISENI